MKKKRKKLFLPGLALFTTFGLVATIAASCSANVANSENVFKINSQTDFLKDNNSPLSSTFSNAPTSTYSSSTLINLTTYERTDSIKDNIQSFDEKLRLEAAEEVQVFENEKNYNDFLANNSNIKPWIIKSNVDINDQQDVMPDVKSKGTVYRFKINTQNYWVDKNGTKKQNLSGKDFERGIESYYLSSFLKYNRNEYFIDLLGIDIAKTVGYKKDSTSNEYVLPKQKDYDINNFANSDDYFTLFLKEPYPYALDILSKEFFSPIPYTNPKVKNIHLGKDSPIKVTSENTLDLKETKFNQIYGSGTEFIEDMWFAGAYYISHFTSTKIFYELNSGYIDSIYSKNFKNKNEKKIDRVILTYGSGNAETFYELFKTKQADFAEVPNQLRSEVIANFKDKGLTFTSIPKSSRSNYVAYSSRPYIINSSNQEIKTNKYINDTAASFLNNWNDKDSLIIRAGVSGLINYNAIGKIALPSSGDFQLSSVPYLNFDSGNYFETVEKSDSFLGGLPRPFKDYSSSSEYLINTSFKIPFYKYENSKIEIEEIEINKQTFIDSLKKVGATKENPLSFSIKFAEPSFSTLINSYWIEFENQLKKLSDDLISVTINKREALNPSVSEWFNEKASPLGFSIWSPDYDGVGTWIESAVLLTSIDSKTKNTPNETKRIWLPNSSSHNSWLTFLSSIVNSVKLTNAQLTSGNNNKQYYKISTTSSDPFLKDKKIQGAFKEENLKMLFKKDVSKLIADAKVSNFNENNVKATDTPGIKFAKLSIEFLNLLIQKDIIDVEKFKNYVEDPSKLKTSKKPNSAEQLLIGGDIIKEKNGDLYNKWLGAYAGFSELSGLWALTVNDSDYGYIPKPEPGVNETNYSLVNPNFKNRRGTSFRDNSYIKK